MTRTFTRCASITMILAISGLAACEREPGPADPAPSGSTRPGDKAPSQPSPALRPNDAAPAPAPAPRDERPLNPSPANPNPANPNPANPNPAPATPPHNPPANPPGQPPAAPVAGDTMTRYIGDLDEATSILRGVHDASTASSATARLTEVADRINASVANFDTLPADQKSRLREQHREKLNQAVSDYRAEADRISRDTALGAGLKSIIDGIKVFE